MRIAGFCGPDTGGQNYKTAQAVTRFSKHELRDFRTSIDYLNFPYTYQNNQHMRAKEARKYLKSIDVAHVHSRIKYMSCWGTTGKTPIVFHFHGRQGRNWRQVRDNVWKNYPKVLISTLNLLKLVHNNIENWFPAPIDVAHFQKMKKKYYKDDGIFRIAHSPTYRGYKGTEFLIKTVKELQFEGYKIELVLIEQTPWRKCLELKAACDATFDQFYLCLGNSGIEGMAFGQPTFCGMHSSIAQIFRDLNGEQPFVYATVRNLKSEMIALVKDKSYRDLWSERSLKYVKKFHDYPVVAERAVKIYEGL